MISPRKKPKIQNLEYFFHCKLEELLTLLSNLVQLAEELFS